MKDIWEKIPEKRRGGDTETLAEKLLDKMPASCDSYSKDSLLRKRSDRKPALEMRSLPRSILENEAAGIRFQCSFLQNLENQRWKWACFHGQF